jgi:hypothetical protein
MAYPRSRTMFLPRHLQAHDKDSDINRVWLRLHRQTASLFVIPYNNAHGSGKIVVCLVGVLQSWQNWWSQLWSDPLTYAKCLWRYLSICKMLPSAIPFRVQNIGPEMHLLMGAFCTTIAPQKKAQNFYDYSSTEKSTKYCIATPTMTTSSTMAT